MKRMYNVQKYILILIAVLLFGCGDDSNNLVPVEQINEFKVEKDIIWAAPEGIELTMDIYLPQTGKSSYPVLVVFHGGGWLFNDNSVLSSFCEYIAQHSEFIVCNVNYRLLGMNSNTTTMNEIVEDAMGAVLWVKDNISRYKGDTSRIAITGDSAGGHLAAMVVMGSTNLSSNRFSQSPLGFLPTYLPAGKTAEDIESENGLSIKAVVLSYASLDIYLNCILGFETPSNPFWSFGGVTARGLFGDNINVNDNADYYIAVSPSRLIPSSSDRKLPPQLCMVGSLDLVVNPNSVKAYVKALDDAGQRVEYWENMGKNHAYLQNGVSQLLGTDFQRDAPAAIDKMIQFLNSNVN